MALVPFLGTDVDSFVNQLQSGHGIAVYRASPMQAGDGLFNWLPFLSRLGPRMISAARMVLPAVGSAAKEVAVDALKGAANAAVNSGADILTDAVNDSSTLQQIPSLSVAATNLVSKARKRAVNTIGEPNYAKKRRVKVVRRTAQDIFT